MNVYKTNTKIPKIKVKNAGNTLSFGTYTLQKELRSAWKIRHIKILLVALKIVVNKNDMAIVVIIKAIKSL